ncbi:MAG: aspartate kinase [Capsulimonadaceae bacterium]
MTSDILTSAPINGLSEPIVAKFGGSSVADASQIRKIESIVRSDPRRRFVVVSAPGKRNSSDKKITDMLYLCHTLCDQGLCEHALGTAGPFGIIRTRFQTIARELGVPGVENWLDDTESRIEAGESRDWIASRGEYLSARLIAAALDADFIDAEDFIRFGADGRFDGPATYALAKRRLVPSSPGRIAVIPGFYGLDSHGCIRCFSRGGSDISGAIVASAVKAAVYENWTDVSGMLMADPRIIDHPRSIEEVTYREQRELSYMGATVLHDEAVFPVREAGIPVHIKNTNAPDDPGTRIVTERDSAETAVVGIAGRKGFASIFTEKAMMNQERGYGRRVLEILEANGVSYEHSPTSIDTMSVIVSDEELNGKDAAIAADLRRIVQPDRIEIQRDMAMIAVVGQGMVQRIGVAASLFAALAEARINIRLINQGSSELNIIVGVAGSDYEKAVRAIYTRFAETHPGA